jgi:hypothetical protein
VAENVDDRRGLHLVKDPRAVGAQILGPDLGHGPRIFGLATL